MKRIVIGRANDCDIVIPDELDNVSRHHAVITFDFFGRMTLSDTSSNGTLINGTKMLKGTSIPVTRKDKIQLGSAWVFDWNQVNDPYRSLRRNCAILAVVLAVVVVGGAIWLISGSLKKSEMPAIEIAEPNIYDTTDTWNKDSTDKVAPTEINIKTSTSTTQSGNVQKTKNRKQKNVSSKKPDDRKAIKNAPDAIHETDNMRMRKEKDGERPEKEMPIIN